MLVWDLFSNEREQCFHHKRLSGGNPHLELCEGSVPTYQGTLLINSIQGANRWATLPHARGKPEVPGLQGGAAPPSCRAPSCEAEGEVEVTQKGGQHLPQGGPWGQTGCYCESWWFLLFLSLLKKEPARPGGGWQYPPRSLTLSLRGSYRPERFPGMACQPLLVLAGKVPPLPPMDPAGARAQLSLHSYPGAQRGSDLARPPGQ